MSGLNERHKDSVAIITGGAQGVGRAIANQLVNEGCRKLVIAGLDRDKNATTFAEFEERGCEVVFVAADLQNVRSCLNLVDVAINAFGNVNVLVNAAGSGARGSLVDTSEETWEHLMGVNARAPFFIMQAFVKHRLEQGGGGSILNIVSLCAHCGQSYLAAYSASKGALATLTKNVANAYRFDQIRCNAISPGWMDTPGEDATQRRFHGATDGWLERAEATQPMKQLCKPHQLAHLASYMLSNEAGVMTGAMIDYDQNVNGAYPE